jgi:Zn finger protein HypA/HybF involved in hydrogenase expression
MEAVALGYRIMCRNEWCSGPEMFEWRTERPTEPIRCPTCGRVADVSPVVDRGGDEVAEWNEWDVICPRCESKDITPNRAGIFLCLKCGHNWENIDEEG